MDILILYGERLVVLGGIVRYMCDSLVPPQ